MSMITVIAGLSEPSSLSPWADEDNCEFSSNAQNLETLLKRFSFSSSWIHTAHHSAETLGCTDATAATVVYAEQTPWSVGERVGEGICLGSFPYDVSAPSVYEIETWYQRLQNPELGTRQTQLRLGVDDLVKRRLTRTTLVPNQSPPQRVVDSAANTLNALSSEDKQDLVLRSAALQEEVVMGFKTIRLTTCRVWFLNGAIVGITAETETMNEKPTDMPRAVEPSHPTDWPNVRRVYKNLMIDAETNHDWKSTLRLVQDAWTPQVGWRGVAVIFANRAEAQAVQEMRLFNPMVMGWYRHSTGVYQPM